MGPPAGNARRRFLRGLAVSLATLVLLALVAEVLLRVTGDRARSFASTANATVPRWKTLASAGIFEEVPDDVRRYAMRPGAECRADGMTFRVSSHRTRGPDFPAAKPAGEKRLLALGDSFCFGLWCDEDETVVARLARLASEREAELGTGITWRAINTGVPGYHSGQQLRALVDDGLALDPDLVLLYFNTNDIECQGYFLDAELGVLRRDFLPLPTGLKRLLWSSHLYGWIVQRYQRAVESPATPGVLDPHLPYSYLRADNQRATAEAIRAIAARCQQRGLPLFFLHQPQLTWQGDLRSPDWELLPLVRWAEDLRADLGLPGVNLLPLFRGYSDNVDRGDGSYDFLLDLCVSDPRVQAAVEWARESAREQGLDWPALTYSQRLSVLAGYRGEIPEDVDFHLTGEGYGMVARAAWAALRGQGLMP